MATIAGIYSNYESFTSLVLTPLPVGLLLLLMDRGLFLKDGSHLEDSPARISSQYLTYYVKEATV